MTWTLYIRDAILLLPHTLCHNEEELWTLYLYFLCSWIFKRHTDSFVFCCLLPRQEQCSAPSDKFSSCSDLLKSDILRVLMWILGVSALVGNLFVIIFRIFQRKQVETSQVWFSLYAYIHEVINIHDFVETQCKSLSSIHATRFFNVTNGNPLFLALMSLIARW